MEVEEEGGHRGYGAKTKKIEREPELGGSGVMGREPGRTGKISGRLRSEEEGGGAGGGHCVSVPACLPCGGSDPTPPQNMSAAGCACLTPLAVGTHRTHTHSADCTQCQFEQTVHKKIQNKSQSVSVLPG